MQEGKAGKAGKAGKRQAAGRPSQLLPPPPLKVKKNHNNSFLSHLKEDIKKNNHGFIQVRDSSSSFNVSIDDVCVPFFFPDKLWIWKPLYGMK
jgi:hypothetical protein